MRVAYPHDVAEDVTIGPSLVLGDRLFVFEVQLVFSGMLECSHHGNLHLGAASAASSVEQ